MKKLYLVDAYAMIYKAYYAFMGRPMRNRAGLNTSAVFGFAKFIRDLVVRETPRYLGVAFDPRGGSFRRELYPEYKANRAATPEDIELSIPYIKRILGAMRIPVLEMERYEADDVIGTLSAKAAGDGYTVYMVTPDKDFGQLVGERVFIYKQSRSGEGTEIIGPEQIKEHYGISDPRQVIDILALWGDASDNIPGVPGIGEKSAAKLVSEYGSVENLLARADSLKGKQKENILASRDQLLLSKELATIKLDVPIDFVPSELEMERPDCRELVEIYRELDFNMFIREIEGDRPSPFREVCCEAGEREPAAPQARIEEQKNISAGRNAAPVQRDLFGGGAGFPEGELSDDPALRSEFAAAEAAGYSTLLTTPHDYRIASALDEVAALAEELGRRSEVCFDTETTGFDCFTSRIVGISFAVAEYEAWYVPLSPDDEQEKLSLLKPVLENPGIAKIGQNIKFDLTMLAQAGIEVAGFLYDTMILHYLLDPESRHGMTYLANKYLTYSPVEIESLIGRGSRQIDMSQVPVERAAEDGAEDADVTLRLKNVLWPLVEEQNLAELYRTVEEPLIRVLARMETVGVKIDAVQLAEYGRTLRRELAAIEDRIREATGMTDVNLNSSRQLGIILFERLRIDAKPKRTRTGQYSTDEEYLLSIADRHPVVGMVLEYRGIKKLLSTYVEALPELVNPVTGRIHTSFNQAVTSTGRLSSTNPNLQNIPIREEQGRQIRKAFVPSDRDHVLLSVDYSQVELRLMADLSGDEALIDAFRHGEDIHSATASRLFGVPLPEVTAEQRRRAKTANFGIIYGISAFGLKQRIVDISLQEAREIIEGYFASYPGVKKYMDDVIARAREDKYVTTIFGRRRWLPDIDSANSVARSLAERNAINAPLQGSAADIIKLAMIRVDGELRRRGLSSRMILQVHDELVLDVPRSELEEVRALVCDAMENVVHLKVALTADAGYGDNWLEAH